MQYNLLDFCIMCFVEECVKSVLSMLVMKPSRTVWGSWAQKPFCVLHSLFVGNRLQPLWPSQSFKRQIWITANQGREVMQGQGRRPPEARVKECRSFSHPDPYQQPYPCTIAIKVLTKSPSIGTHFFRAEPVVSSFAWQSNKTIVFCFTQNSVSEIWFGTSSQRLSFQSASVVTTLRNIWNQMLS